MLQYKGTVQTSDRAHANTKDYLYITLVGENDESEETQIPSNLLFGVASVGSAFYHPCLQGK